MTETQFTTIGKEIHTGLEVKIYCVNDVDCLEVEGLNGRFRIVCIKEGYGVLRNGDRHQIVTSPSVLCLNEDDNVELHDTVGLKMDIMYFDPTCFERYVEFENLEVWRNSLSGHDYWLFRPFFERNESYIGASTTNYYLGKRISELIVLTDKILTEQRDEFWPCRGRSYFIELILVVNSIYNEDNDREKIFTGKMSEEMNEVVNWLQVHYLEKLTMETITKQFHTNKTTLNQKFKAVMGVTVMEYITSLRMEIACSFLRKTWLSISEIMERAGYKDDAHFLRVFKKYAGCTPSEYRSQSMS